MTSFVAFTAVAAAAVAAAAAAAAEAAAAAAATTIVSIQPGEDNVLLMFYPLPVRGVQLIFYQTSS